MTGVATISAGQLANNLAEDGFSPADETRRPRLSTFSGITTLRPRFVSPDNGDMAQLDTVFHEWGNDGEVLPGDANEFTTQTDSDSTPSSLPASQIVSDGILNRRDRFSGGGYAVGLRHYFEEGVFRVHHPYSGQFALAHHASTYTRGKLTLTDNIGGGLLNFRWQQANTAGTANETFDFETNPVEITQLSAATKPQYTYYHFRREYDGTTQSDMALTVNTDTETKTQAGLYSPDSGGIHRWGGDIDVYGGNDRLQFHVWMRAGWSDTQLSGTVGNSPWPNPRLYDTTIYQAHGAYSGGWLDSGSAGQYWQDLTFLSAAHLWDSTLEFRATAVDSVFRGSLSGTWDGLQWKTASPTAPVDLSDPSAGYPQGRYLLLQFRFTPASQISLYGATSELSNDSSGAAISATHLATAPTADPVPIVLNGEGTATATLPVTPQYSFEKRLNRQAVTNQFDAPYAQSYPVETKTRREWEVNYTAITDEQKELLDAFFVARVGGAEAFDWTPEDESSTVTAALVNDQVSFDKLAPNVWRVSSPLEFREVL